MLRNISETLFCYNSHYFYYFFVPPFKLNKEDLFKRFKHHWKFEIDVCLERMPELSDSRLNQSNDFDNLFVDRTISKSRFSDFELSQKKILSQESELNRLILERKVSQKDLIISRSDDEDSNLSQHILFSDLEHFGRMQLKGNVAEGEFLELSTQTFSCRPLYLLIRSSIGNDWRFPHISLTNNTSLLFNSYQVIKDIFLNPCFQINTYYPISFLELSGHEEHFGSNFYGLKIFFTKLIYKSGKPLLQNKNIPEFKWCTKEEIRHLVSHEYLSAIETMIFD